jgi:ATP-dependent Lon protease
LSYVRSRAKQLNISEDAFSKVDLHIHVPAGAIPKDGPSAGITMATAIASALTGKTVRKDVAMTGEVTLRGRVLPIGGLKEKTLAAKRMGIKTVIIPHRNKKDLEDLPKYVKEGMNFILAETMDDVLKTAVIGDKKGAKTKKVTVTAAKAMAASPANNRNIRSIKGLKVKPCIKNETSSHRRVRASKGSKKKV